MNIDLPFIHKIIYVYMCVWIYINVWMYGERERDNCIVYNQLLYILKGNVIVTGHIWRLLPAYRHGHLCVLPYDCILYNYISI